MKRFHVNLSVEDVAESIRFYSALFAAEPAVLKDDYAKWMLDDPRLNFSITRRGLKPGINHLGFQVDTAAELTGMRAQLERADHALIEQADAACCYAKSDKYWITDPTGVAWETFHTLSSIPVYGADTDIAPKTQGCCVPLKATAAACCPPQHAASNQSCCPASSEGDDARAG
jgi:catechol 2,3-dioxygenase-like lactoylglutathione lyase family enzyme